MPTKHTSTIHEIIPFFCPFFGGNALPAKNKLLFLLPKTIIVSSKWTTITRKILINRQGKSIRQVSPSF